MCGNGLPNWDGNGGLSTCPSNDIGQTIESNNNRHVMTVNNNGKQFDIS